MGISRGLKVAQLLAGFPDGITLYVDRPFVPQEYQCFSWLGTAPSVYLCNLRACWLLHQDESVPLNEGGMEMDIVPVAGIDVSKRFSDLCILSPENQEFSATRIYHDKTSMDRARNLLLKAQVEFGHAPVIVMESTSHYHLVLYQYFSKAGFEVLVINPLQSHALRNVNVRRIKNDMRTSNDGLEVVTQVTLPVGGFVPTAYRWTSESIAPNIYVSNELLLKLIPDAQPYSVQFNVSDDQERSVYDTLTAEIAASSTMRLSSRIQAKERLRQMQSVLYLLGGGIAVLLGFVGLLNFVNILSASIVRRKVEFAILESIGMTKRQLRQQVIYEGASYAIIAILLFSTLGTTLTLILLNVFSSQVSYALCRYPVLPTLLIVIALILLSAVIPTILFQCSRKTSLIDRLRSVE